MKVAGQKLLVKNRRRVVLTRLDESDQTQQIVLLVTPLPLGWQELMRSRGVLDYPEAPKVPLKDEDGKVILDRRTREPKVLDKTDDPKFRKRLAQFSRRTTALKFASHLRDDESIQFEASEPEDEAAKDEWIRYADRLWSEIDEAGFNDDELAEVLAVGEALAVNSNARSVLDFFLEKGSRPEERNGASSATPPDDDESHSTPSG